VTDNEIVTLATADNTPVLPFFIIDPWFYTWADIGTARVRFLFESLIDLDRQLQELGSRLVLFEGNSTQIIQDLTTQLISQGDRPKLFFNRDVQVEYGVSRDRSIVEFSRELNLDCHLGLNNFLQTQDNRQEWFRSYYTYQRQPQHQHPRRLDLPALAIDVPQLTFPELTQKYAQFWDVEKVYFPGGETNAHSTLDSFLASRFPGYHWKLSRPWLAQLGATSHLSPHLTFGTISTRTVYQATKARVAELAGRDKAEFSLKAFRDSFTQRLYFYPEIAYQNRYPEFDDWYKLGELTSEQLELYQAWQEGMTGFPLIDASMRQLHTMGWMNFRMRAMCATFLTINCGVSWQHGAKHFMNYLVDGDLAIDNWQWQMQAGVTNPLSETFRIYNPNKNIAEKDPDLSFIHHWIPELQGYDLSEVSDGRYTDSYYPQPVLDWSQTRKVNGKIVADLRKQVRARLVDRGGAEYDSAIAAKETVEKYKAAGGSRISAYKHGGSTN
jgi:deoxyribodipyrimidine photo-lyase